MSTTVSVSKKAVELVFENMTSRNAVIELHRLVVPDWDRVRKLKGFVRCSQECARKLCRLAIEADEARKVDFPGGAWLNWGWSGDGILTDSGTRYTLELPEIEMEEVAR